MLRRAVATAYSLDSLAVEDVPAREVTPGRVVVAVSFAAIDRADLKSITGVFGDDPSRLPLRPGAEVAGTVTSVGPPEEGKDATSFAVGDAVVAYPVTGGWADEVLVPVRNVRVRPAALDPETAAGLLLPGVTAWHLVEATGVGAGDRVIVHGASGAVGRIAVQLALMRGATVVGTASPRNLAAVEDLGATAVDYGDPHDGAALAARLRAALPRTAGDGGAADAALDTAGTDAALDASVALVTDRARVATVAGFVRGAELGVQLLGAGAGADPGTEVRRAAREPLLELAASGRLRPLPARVLPLDRVREAVGIVDSGRADARMLLRAGH